jgi:hypothetical protein
MTEAELQQAVSDLVALYGWAAYHTYDSRRSEPGFPDLVVGHAGRGELFVAELKSEKGRLTAAQESWLSLFEAAGVETHILRPAQLGWVAWRLGPRGYRTRDVGAVI